MMNAAKWALAGALAVSSLFSASDASAALAPASREYFHGIWDLAMLAAWRGDGAAAQATCDLYTSQIWPDPAANEVALPLRVQCRISVVNIYIHHTNPLPFPL